MADNIRVFPPGFRVTDTSGSPAASATITFYDAGTSNLRTVYSTNDLSTTSLGSTVTCNSAGAPSSDGTTEVLIYTGTTDYKVVIKDSTGSTLHSFDNVTGALDTSSFSAVEAIPLTTVTQKSGDYTIVDGDQGDVFDTDPTGANITLTLPSAIAVADGWRTTVKHTGTANTVTLSPVLSQTIDGATSYVLNFQHEAVTIVSDGANWLIADDSRKTADYIGFTMINGVLDASVAASALTVSIKTLAGNDPSATDPVFVLFRSDTLTNGGYIRRRITAATSVTVSSGSTLGTSNSTAFRLWVTAHDNSGTVALGVSNRKTSTGISPLNEAAQITTTAEGGAGAADSAATIYTTSAVTSKAMTILGYLDWASGLSTAGTWSAAPTTEHLMSPGTKRPGDIVQTQTTTVTAATASSSSTSYADITGMSVAITPASTPNSVLVHGCVNTGIIANNTVGINLVRGSTSIGQGDESSNRTRAITASENAVGNSVVPAYFVFMDNPESVASTTYKLQWIVSTSTVYLNRSSTDTDSATFHRTSSTIAVQEIMA